MHKKIIIFDTTLRDGEQSPGASLTTQEKVIVAKQLAKLGVDVIEAGFPISSKGDFESVQAVAKNVAGPSICGLARCNKKDILSAWEAVKFSEKPRIHVFIATSPLHIEKKLQKTKTEVLQMVSDSVKYAKGLCKDIEFSPEDAARTDIDYMCDVIKAAIAAGATTINIPDTVGYAQPEEFKTRIASVFKKVNPSKQVVISVHCHNDLGLAVANSLAAISVGALQIECTINGIGERAGNCSLEEVVMNIKTRKDYFNEIYTDIKTTEIYPTSQLVSKLTGLNVQRNKAIVGANAFAHEAGIHQHGVISARETYEIMNPAEIGWIGTKLVIGKHSGKHAVAEILKNSGYALEADQIELIMEKVKLLADKEKSIEKEDILALASEILGESGKKQFVKLIKLKICTGSDTAPCAHVTLSINGEEKSGEGSGVGSVDAINSAICGIVGSWIKLKNYTIKATTGGTDALAHVNICVEDENGTLFRAQAINEDINMSSALAIVNGINKAWNKKVSKK